MENFIFCKVALNQLVRMKKYKFRLIEKKNLHEEARKYPIFMTKVLKVIYGYMILSAEKYHKTNIVFCLQVAFFSSLLSSLRKKHFNKIFHILQFLHRYHIFLKKIMKRILYSYKNNASTKAYVLTYSHLLAFKHFLC